MEEGICTTLDPSGDGMFVLGHVENTQTIEHFILLSNSPALLLQVIANILFFIKIKTKTTYIQYIQSGIPSLGQNWKYGLRNWPFTGASNKSPCRFSKEKVLFLPSFTILNGPNHNGSNLACLPFSALRTSHLRTRSPT